MKINERQHAFASIYYVREDGLLASYHPDFIVSDNMYVIETKSDKDARDVNVQRKMLATSEWCKKINELDADNRMGRIWKYVLLTEQNYYSYSRNGATLNDICRLCSVSKAEASGMLF